MENENYYEMAYEHLGYALKEMEKAGLIGIRKFEWVIDDLDFKYTSEVTILRNERFEVFYNKKTDDIEFATTYSNQKIDDDFLNQLQIINSFIDELECYVSTLIAYSE